MDTRVPAVIMRGATSRAVFFREEDLPRDDSARDRILLHVMGSPDPFGRQIDGLGGATSSTSKVAIIAPGRQDGVDVEYTFAQVPVMGSAVDYRSNCGNISAAVGPYSIDEGIVRAEEPITRVRILNTNTGKMIHADVPVRDQAFRPDGDFTIEGIPGTGSRITLTYLDPGGAITGRVLPTGRVCDQIHLPSGETVDVSIVDATAVFVFLRMTALGLTGSESANDINARPELLERLETIRASVTLALGLAGTLEDATTFFATMPRLALVGEPVSYTDAGGTLREAPQYHLSVIGVSMGKAHHAYPITGAMCTTVAALIPGTIVFEMNHGAGKSSELLRLGHRAGITAVSADVRREGDQWQVVSATSSRTARRLMEGHVLIPAFPSS